LRQDQCQQFSFNTYQGGRSFFQKNEKINCPIVAELKKLRLAGDRSGVDASGFRPKSRLCPNRYAKFSASSAIHEKLLRHVALKLVL
jgi:hypothetical protein